MHEAISIVRRLASAPTKGESAINLLRVLVDAKEFEDAHGSTPFYKKMKEEAFKCAKTIIRG